MPSVLPYQWLADVVLSLHFAVVAFVVGGVLAVLLGNRLGWCWVNGLFFRLTHLAAIGFVVLEAWLGAVCPLTRWELWLRAQARSPSYSGSFVAHWLQRILYYEAPAWVFTLAYTLFGLLVLLLWWRFPPRRRHQCDRGSP